MHRVEYSCLNDSQIDLITRMPIHHFFNLSVSLHKKPHAGSQRVVNFHRVKSPSVFRSKLHLVSLSCKSIEKAISLFLTQSQPIIQLNWKFHHLVHELHNGYSHTFMTISISEPLIIFADVYSSFVSRRKILSFFR